MNLNPKAFAEAPGPTIRALWDKLSVLPAGKALFSKAVGQAAPYTGSIGARVEELRPGFARVSLKERRKVRNHLNSIHAVALVNLAEVCTGLAMLSTLPPHVRGIVKGLSIEYLKKARGTVTAECSIELAHSDQEIEVPVEGLITDGSGDIVARATAIWLLRPTA